MSCGSEPIPEKLLKGEAKSHFVKLRFFLLAIFELTDQDEGLELQGRLHTTIGLDLT